MADPGRPMPWPQAPKMQRGNHKMTHITDYCRQEAEKEFEAWLTGEDYLFCIPLFDAKGYLLAAIPENRQIP